jgi:hypothetical protein
VRLSSPMPSRSKFRHAGLSRERRDASGVSRDYEGSGAPDGHDDQISERSAVDPPRYLGDSSDSLRFGEAIFRSGVMRCKAS